MGVDLRELTAETFEPHVDSTFTLTGPVPVPMVLASVARRPALVGFRAPFTLLFHLAPGTPQQQATHALTHPVLGSMEIFMVPVQATPTYARYEAVFG